MLYSVILHHKLHALFSYTTSSSQASLSGGRILVPVCRAVYRIFAKGGPTWSMSKRGGVRLFVAAGQPQGGGGFKGGENNSRGRMPPPTPPKYTPEVYGNGSGSDCISDREMSAHQYHLAVVGQH